MSFSTLGLSQRVQDAVEATGYTTPTPIQAQAIPEVLNRRDVLGIAQTGTGKTAAFTLPMLSILEQGRARARMPRTLILEPTRELAAQVEEAFIKYSGNQKLSVALLIGGVSFADQDAKITRGVDVLIATPGRLLDHFERGKLLLTGIEILVIDEADRMLDMGFIPDIERIAGLCPFTRQTLFFTATMPAEIQRITEKFLSNPVKIEVERQSTTATTITQNIVATNGRDFEKRETLRRLIRAAQAEDSPTPLKNGIIFCNRKTEVANLLRSLQRYNFSSGALHGDMDQRSRMNTLDSFRKGELTLLVASDVAARGLDIPDVSHVFNFDVPFHAEDYVHRIGRTGRAGRLGSALTLVSPKDGKAIDAIVKLIGKPIEWLEGDLSTLPEPVASEERPARRGREEGRSKREPSRPRRGSEREHVRTDREQNLIDAAATGEDIPAAPRLERKPRPPREDQAPREPRPPREVAPRDDAAPREPRPPREDRAPREARPPREERAPREPRAEAEHRLPAPRRDPNAPRRYREPDDGPNPVGFGDHVPGFLTRK